MKEEVIPNIKKVDKLIGKMMFKIIDKDDVKRPPSILQAQIMKLITSSYSKNKIITQKEIEEKLNISRAAISEALGKMEIYGMIKRKNKEDDARIKIIIPTDKSMEIAKKMKKNITTLNNKVNELLTDKEKEQLNTILNKLINGLEKELK